jgi:hypothetical protein
MTYIEKLESDILNGQSGFERYALCQLLISSSFLEIRQSISENEIQRAVDTVYAVVETLARVGEVILLRKYLEEFDECLPNEIVVAAVICTNKHRLAKIELMRLFKRWKKSIQKNQENDQLVLFLENAIAKEN